MNGNKVDFTNGVFKNMNVTEFVESPPVIKRIDTPLVIKRTDTPHVIETIDTPAIETINTPPINISNDHITIPIGTYVPDIITIETYIGIDNLQEQNTNLPIGLSNNSLNNNLPIGLKIEYDDNLYN
jgi:hypothetical protein